MKNFKFVGNIQSSKSVLNRAWLAKSYAPQLQILGDSHCDDVNHMKLGLYHLAQKKEIDCGDSGTVFRFLALRASREPGSWIIRGTPRLMSRPQKDLAFIMEQLGVDADLTTQSLNIYGQGWKKPISPLRIHREQSSQFASSLLLNSWNLDFPLEFDLRGAGVSEGYWKMSLAIAAQLGMKIDSSRTHFIIPAQQHILIPEIKAEVDHSSAFAVAAAAALMGEAEILNCDPDTKQPDFVFIEALKKMGVPISLNNHHLTVKKAASLSSIELNLSSAPDLFPVLAVLCAFATKESMLFGASHLAFKESNRIKKTLELLRGIGVRALEMEDGLKIPGLPPNWKPDPITFDPDHDHRMAMAAGLLKLKGYPITIRNPEVVTKSFPEFWTILGIRP